MTTKINVRAFKLTAVLPPEPFTGLSVTDAPQELSLNFDGRQLAVTVKAKSLRQAIKLIAQHGADKVVVIVQGKLGKDETITEAGLTAQIKVAKPAAATP